MFRALNLLLHGLGGFQGFPEHFLPNMYALGESGEWYNSTPNITG